MTETADVRVSDHHRARIVAAPTARPTVVGPGDHGSSRAIPAARLRPRADPMGGSLLRLQRLAGNRATASLLAGPDGPPGHRAMTPGVLRLPHRVAEGHRGKPAVAPVLRAVDPNELVSGAGGGLGTATGLGGELAGT